MKEIDSNRTCGPRCWNARHDVCRCLCGGRYHGRLYHGDPIGRQLEVQFEGTLAQYLKFAHSQRHPTATDESHKKVANRCDSSSHTASDDH